MSIRPLVFKRQQRQPMQQLYFLFRSVMQNNSCCLEGYSGTACVLCLELVDCLLESVRSFCFYFGCLWLTRFSGIASCARRFGLLFSTRRGG